ncbi:MAG: protein phosphatase 2C family protein [Verrucomicrobia bacterium]|nr:protein phosphatase 2C family protein [Verrucomicrobiota bacterium]
MATFLELSGTHRIPCVAMVDSVAATQLGEKLPSILTEHLRAAVNERLTERSLCVASKVAFAKLDIMLCNSHQFASVVCAFIIDNTLWVINQGTTGAVLVGPNRAMCCTVKDDKKRLGASHLSSSDLNVTRYRLDPNQGEEIVVIGPSMFMSIAGSQWLIQNVRAHSKDPIEKVAHSAVYSIASRMDLPVPLAWMMLRLQPSASTNVPPASTNSPTDWEIVE